MRVRASGLSGGFRVGADFFERNGLVVAGAPPPCGVVDRIEDLAHPGIDVTRLAPSVVAFFDDTASLSLHVRSRWVFPVSVLWRLLFFLVRWLGQFVYPRADGRVITRVVAIDRAKDGRADARGIVRTYEGTGDVMQAVSYATWERDGTRLMSAAFPVFFGRIMGLLRLDHVGNRGAVLTSTSKDDDDAGVWYVLGALAIPLPLSERLELWPPDEEGAPHEPVPEGVPEATIVGRHEQRCFGLRFVTHHYWFWPSNREPRPKT